MVQIQKKETLRTKKNAKRLRMKVEQMVNGMNNVLLFKLELMN